MAHEKLGDQAAAGMDLENADEGGLEIAMTTLPDGRIHINFGKKVKWLVFSRNEAFEFARALMRRAADQVVTMEKPDAGKND